MNDEKESPDDGEQLTSTEQPTRTIHMKIPLYPSSGGTCNHGPGFVCRVCDPLDCYSRR